MAAVNASHAVASVLLDDMIAQCEQADTADCTPYKQLAEVLPLSNNPLPQSPWLTLRVGLLVGMSISLLLVLPIVCQRMQQQSSSLPNLLSALPVFRCVGLLIIYMWLWAACTYTLDRTRVDWKYLLSVDAASALTPVDIVQAAAVMTALWLGALELYLYCSLERSDDSFTPPIFIPFSLFVVSLLLVFCPFRRIYHRTRLFVGRALWRIVRAPLLHVDFPDTFVADQLCSLVAVLGDLFYSLFFFLSGNFVTSDSDTSTAVTGYAFWVLAILPYYWRLQQCMRRYRDTGNTRFVWNAVKHCLSILITLLSLTYRQVGSNSTLALWVVAAFFGTCYIYYWDIKVSTHSPHIHSATPLLNVAPSLVSLLGAVLACVRPSTVRLGSAGVRLPALVAPPLSAAPRAAAAAPLSVLLGHGLQPLPPHHLGVHHLAHAHHGHPIRLRGHHRVHAGGAATQPVELPAPRERTPQRVRTVPRRQPSAANHNCSERDGDVCAIDLRREPLGCCLQPACQPTVPKQRRAAHPGKALIARRSALPLSRLRRSWQ